MLVLGGWASVLKVWSFHQTVYKANYNVLQRTIERVPYGSSLGCDYVIVGTKNVLVDGGKGAVSVRWWAGP